MTQGDHGPRLQLPQTIWTATDQCFAPLLRLAALRCASLCCLAAVESTNLRVLLWRFIQIAVRHTHTATTAAPGAALWRERL